MGNSCSNSNHITAEVTNNPLTSSKKDEEVARATSQDSLSPVPPKKPVKTRTLSFLSVFKQAKGQKETPISKGGSVGKHEVTYTWAYGRRKVANCPYLMPNDFEEIDRLDYQHYMFRYAMKANYLAPLEWSRVSNVLDVGAGTGIWISELASERPKTRFHGIDIAPLQPARTLPKNISFEYANVLEGLPYPDQTFDYVHARLLIAAIPRDDWPRLIAEYYRVLKPGGYLEVMEPDGVYLPAEEYMNTINSLVVQILLMRGIDILMVGRLESHLEKAGFVDIEKTNLKIPCGKWGGKLGELHLKDYSSVIIALSGAMISKGLVTKARFNVIMENWEEELNRLKVSGSMYYHVCRKPQ